MKTVAIIPARGGSKGIPKKNLIDFCGKPLLYWSVAAALKSGVVDRVFVSSDSDEILAAAKTFGGEAIKRPADLSGDTATSESALIHGMQTIKKEYGTVPERILFLQATSPLRQPGEITAALANFDAGGFDSMFSGAEGEDFLWWRQGKEGLSSLNYDYENRKRRQDHDGQTRLLLETGSFYITRSDLLLKTENRLCGKIGVHLVPFWKGFEVDSLDSLALCAIVMKHFGLDRELS